ncbi:hypothetical protein [Chelativorans sp. AA-79]|uniref:hypothetical protein n=1 Tax=Chelativorans sp. AA-79 TaxID=3028735 RepID=UPI0023F82ECF|nr:hypothetical protein [Chelativorans sp. AA-79]WEX09247.1 hypothetical protein PVE73_25000 [Chelativorans sp. AA-79]
MRKTVLITAILTVAGAGSALAGNDSPFQTPQISAPASQVGSTVNAGYSAADDFGPSSNNALPKSEVGAQAQNGNVDRDIVTSGVPVTRFPDAATQQFKVSDD